MDENEPYLIPNNRKNNSKRNKKDYDSEEEENNEENESLSEIKQTPKKNNNTNDEDSENYAPIIKKNKASQKNKNNNNYQEEIYQDDDEKNDSLIDIAKDSVDTDKLLKIIKKKEKEIKEKDGIINGLKKEISEKDKNIKLITKTNNKLQLSLNEFSKKIDDKLFNSKNIFCRKTKYNLKNNNNNNNNDDELKQKELDNAMNIIKILKNDNQRLQTAIDNYEKNNKLQDLENMNKLKADENLNLENQIKILKKELKGYGVCLKKCKILENQIEILNNEIKTLKNNNKILKTKLDSKIPKNNSTIDLSQDNRNSAFISPKKIDGFNKNISYVKKSRNIINSNSDRHKIKINDNYNSINNNKDIYSKTNNRTSNLRQSHQSMGYLPSIRLKKQVNIKNISPIGLTGYKKNYDAIKNEILKKFFDPEDLDIINKIFVNNANGLEAFKLKLCIIHKSKESLNTKYNLEIKKYNERIVSAQEQIEYLNTKIRESEVSYRVLQTQMNEFVIQKKLLLKKIKKLEENIIEKDNILKLNFAGEDINNDNEMIDKKNDSNEENDSNKNSDDEKSTSKIVKDEDSNESKNKEKENENKTENSQNSEDKK